MRNKGLVKNAISGLGGQLFVVVLGIIIPRIMIINYGSDLNGVVLTASQIYTYLALLEAGIGQSARIALYKPITNSDRREVSRIYKSAESYFRKVTVYYFCGVVLISVILPIFLKSDVDFLTIFLISGLEGLSGVVTFFFIQTPSVLLNADGKAYINNSVTVVDKIACYSAKILLALLGTNIVVVEIAFFFISICKVIFYKSYMRSKYPWIESKDPPDYSLLKDKNSFLFTEIAWTIFASTDMIVISIFVSTKVSSAYSIYNMVFNNLNLLLKSIGGSVLYVLGQKYNKGIKEYAIYHDAFDTFFMTVITILMSTCYVLILPFITLYTQGVTDTEYIYTQFPLLFALIQMMSWNRYVTGNLTGLAGYAKTTSYISIVEATMNVVLSILLVNLWGITGVLIATVVALPIKVVWCIYITDVKVLRRSIVTSIKNYGINYFLFFMIVVISKHFSLNMIELSSYGQFFLVGAVVFILVGIAVVTSNVLVNRKTWSMILSFMCERVKVYFR